MFVLLQQAGLNPNADPHEPSLIAVGVVAEGENEMVVGAPKVFVPEIVKVVVGKIVPVSPM
jgi:hypothetical protein